MLLATAPFAGCAEAWSPAPAVVSVEPTTLVAGHRYELLVTGSFTRWSGATRVSLGPGISSAGEVIVASPEHLLVPIEVAAEIDAGPRAVEVTTGGSRLRLDPALEVVPRVEVRGGPLKPGGIGFFELTGHGTTWLPGFATAFAGSTTEDGFLSSLVAASLAVYVEDSERAHAMLQADLFAPAGSFDLAVVHKERTELTRAAVPIAESPAAIALESAAPHADSLLADLDTDLYRVPGLAAGEWVTIEIEGAFPPQLVTFAGVLTLEILGGPMTQLYPASAGGLRPAAYEYETCFAHQAIEAGDLHFVVSDAAAFIAFYWTGPAPLRSPVDYPIDYAVTATRGDAPLPCAGEGP